ncbi:MAG: hypothetical protein ACE5QW_09800 [Thermoplasmata archaeon]
MRTKKYRHGRLILHKTYYTNGFFNETEEMPSFPRPEDDSNSPVILECLGPVSSKRIRVEVRYKGFDGRGKWINQDHKARIFGGRELAQWFQENFHMGAELVIEAIRRNKVYRTCQLKEPGTKAFQQAIPQSSHQETEEETMSPSDFQKLAARKLYEEFGIAFSERQLDHVPKRFDFVSEDGEYVGDAKFLTMVRGKNIPSAKFSVISEHIWFLEKTQASTKFLVFGNDDRVPKEWLKRYGHLSRSVRFYFLDHESMRLVELC